MELSVKIGRVSSAIGAGFGFKLEALGAKIQQQASFDLGGGEIIDQLNGMRNAEGFNGLDFDYEPILYYQISVKESDFSVLVIN